MLKIIAELNPYILHIHFPDLFVHIEYLRRPQLKVYPLIIRGGGARSVALATNSVARNMGLRVGMPLRRAKQLCPSVIALPEEAELYQRAGRRMIELLSSRVPLFEASLPDRFWVDLTGMDRFYGTHSYAKSLGQYLQKQLKLPLRLGLGHNKLLAQLAADQSRLGELNDWTKREALAKLAVLPISALPGVGSELSAQLQQMGVRDVGTLARLPRQALIQAFGKLGQRLFEMARGEDLRPLKPIQTEAQLRARQRFEAETDEPQVLRRSLHQLVEQLSFQLRQRELCTTQLQLRLRYSNGESEQRQLQIPFCNADEHLTPYVQQLLDKLYQRRMRVRSLELALMGLVKGHPQLGLFQSQARQVDLYQSLDRLRLKYGPEAVKRASGL